MKYVNDIRNLIGNTPILKLNNISPNENVNIFAKLEYLNPGGSIKDRIGFEIIKDAEEKGLLKKGYTIIEATAGNTGIGLALAAVQKGYNLKIVVPEKFSIEKQTLMRALGAELVITPSDEGIEGAIKKADELHKLDKNSFLAKQFDNPANIIAHRKTGKEIYDALDGKIDVFVAGAGSGGTITGIAQYLKEKNPNIKIVLSDPVGSILGGGKEGKYKIEGIGNHFFPKVFDKNLIDEVEKIADDEAMYYVRMLSKKEGILAGSSSGAAVAGAIKQSYKAKGKLNIVTILPDRSDRYFSEELYDFSNKPSDFRFNELFENYADNYDETVYNMKDGEYGQIYENYSEILNETVKHINKNLGSTVLDIGSGTGNLTNTAAKAGYHSIGLEPNSIMRKIASEKYPNIDFIAGTFLSMPIDDNSIDSVITSYSLHNLTDSDKEEFIKNIKSKLKDNGNLIIADTMFQTPEIKHLLIKNAHDAGKLNLEKKLRTKYYIDIPYLKNILEKNNFKVSYQQMNKYVWIITAKLES